MFALVSFHNKVYAFASSLKLIFEKDWQQVTPPASFKTIF
jgi:hypothetical protein